MSCVMPVRTVSGIALSRDRQEVWFRRKAVYLSASNHNEGGVAVQSISWLAVRLMSWYQRSVGF